MEKKKKHVLLIPMLMTLFRTFGNHPINHDFLTKEIIAEEKKIYIS